MSLILRLNQFWLEESSENCTGLIEILQGAHRVAQLRVSPQGKKKVYGRRAWTVELSYLSFHLDSAICVTLGKLLDFLVPISSSINSLKTSTHFIEFLRGLSELTCKGLTQKGIWYSG